MLNFAYFSDKETIGRTLDEYMDKVDKRWNMFLSFSITDQHLEHNCAAPLTLYFLGNCFTRLKYFLTNHK